MNNFETIIGIEIHIELNTKTKMFSPAPNNFDSEANTNVSVIDLAYPGTLPLINKKAVEKAIKLAKALNMEIDSELHFDRKHYFYFDLPKGFQITQNSRPIAKNGTIPISNRKIDIAFFHLEEDTAKTIGENNKILLDYNRAGVPLIEIVTTPTIYSAKEAVEYIEAIRLLVNSLDISDAKMEEGSLRADINISIRPFGQKELGTKMEIKNLNSLNNVEKGINDLINKLTIKMINGEDIVQSTMRFDELKQEVVLMREKANAADYKFFPESNLPIIKLDQEWIDSIKINELPWDRRVRYLNSNIELEYVDKLMSDLSRANFFDEIDYHDKQLLSKIFFSEVVQIANSLNKNVQELKINPKELTNALLFLESGVISGKQIKELIPLLVNSTKTSEEIIEEKNMKQLSDEKQLKEIIGKIINANKNFIDQNFIDRKERVLKQLLGQLMKETNGKANPIVSNKIILEILGE